MKVFRIKRERDISGVSGIGYVVDGIIFEDGTTVIHWKGKHASTNVFKSYKDFKAIHIDPHPENNSIEEIKEVKWNE